MEDKLMDLLSRLEPNQKICLKDQSIVDANSWTGSLYRYWYEENRDDLLKELRALVSHLSRYSEETVSQAIQGLNNLLITYQSDPFFCHEIALLVKEFEGFVLPVPVVKKTCPEEGVFVLHGHKPILVAGVGNSGNLGNYAAIGTIVCKHINARNARIESKADSGGGVSND